MGNVAALDNLFKPRRSKTELKADSTTDAARAILDAEAEQREAKTDRLRQARLQMEAAKATSEPPVRPRRVKAVAIRRARSTM